MNRSISFFALVFTLFSACGQATFEEKLASIYRNAVPLIFSDSLEKKVETGEIVLLDTRTKKEFDISHLKGAKFIDYDNFSEEDLNGINKNAEVVVYCSVGYRSERIGENLQKLGFSNVKNLYGGIFEWKNTDHEVVNKRGLVTDSIHTYNKNWSQWLEKGTKVYE